MQVGVGVAMLELVRPDKIELDVAALRHAAEAPDLRVAQGAAEHRHQTLLRRLGPRDRPRLPALGQAEHLRLADMIRTMARIPA
jgi:hypothetical protein